MTPKKRKGDEETFRTPLRCDRFYVANGQWFFSTREGREIGPFNSRGAAAARLDEYIVHMKLANSKRLAVHQTYFA